MADEGHDYADARLEEFQREVADVYRQAEETARKRLEEHLARFEERDGEKRRQVAAGEMTEQAYADWRRAQMMTGRRYEQVLDQVAQAYANANQVAVDVLNGKLPEVYAENANYGGWQACEATGLNLSWSLMDADTAQHMLAAGEAMFAAPALDVAKDAAWNRKLMASQLTQGILLGESIPKLAKRMQRVMGSNYAAAVRTARTATTGAENAGRVASYKRAQAMGIKLEQEWLATLDGRTRHTHRQLDGERREVGQAFSNGCRYPGDPQARGSEIYNCRCTLAAAIDGVDASDGERWSKLPPGMTYEQWKAGKPAVNGTVPANRTIGEFMDMPGTARKLEAAGVSPTEARKRLTEQLKEYGIPSGSFRKMSAGDQQKVLDGALATERGITSKQHAASGAKVDMDIVKSDGYAAKFSKLDMPGDAVKSLHESAVAMLTHRSGSELEDLVLVSRSSGKVVARSTAGTVPFETARNAEIEKAISSHPRGDLISVHNHPTNIPPTGSDFASAGYNGYGCGLVALHNGEVYYYEVGDVPFLGKSFDKKVSEKVKMGLDEYDAIIEVMRAYERSHGIKWERL